MTVHTESGAALRTPTDRVEGIFRRYPAISPDEAQEALAFLQNGPHLEVGLVTGNSELRDNIAAFRHQHRKALRLGLRDYLKFGVVFTLLVVLPIATLAYW